MHGAKDGIGRARVAASRCPNRTHNLKLLRNERLEGGYANNGEKPVREMPNYLCFPKITSGRNGGAARTRLGWLQ
jgi:hypothetical protein